MIFILITGLSMVKVEVFTRATGQIVNAESPISIGTIVSGIITDLPVKEGDLIGKNKIIAKIDNEQFSINIKNLKAEIKDNLNNIALIKNLLSEKDEYPPLKPSVLLKLSNQHKEYIKDLRKLIEFDKKEKKILDKLVSQSSLPVIKSIQITQKLMKDESEINKSIKEFWERLIFDLEAKKSRVTVLKGLLKTEEFKHRRSYIYSPKSGMISKLFFRQGEFVRSGAIIAEIIPKGEKLQIEMKVSPKDIGGIKHGQKVKIKIETFNYKIFGTSDAVISYISPRANFDGLYMVKCNLVNNYIIKNNQRFIMKPGMNVFASVIRGEVSGFSYFVGPLIKSFHLLGVL